jgi:hypothetical protein
MTTGATASAVISAAESQIGIKYAYGTESPGKDFDCSGLVQWAYSTVGIKLPRTSQDQYTATARVAAGNVEPGDLVFSAGSDGTATAPGHVGIYLGGNSYIDSPFTGADVRVDTIPKGATYGRVSGLTLGGGLVKPGFPAPATTGVGCSAKGGGINLDPLSSLPLVGGLAPKATIGTACQLKALSGALMVGGGFALLMIGGLMLAGKTGPGKRAGKAGLGYVTGGPAGALAGASTGAQPVVGRTTRTGSQSDEAAQAADERKADRAGQRLARQQEQDDQLARMA